MDDNINVIRLLNKAGVVSSLGNLHESIEKLSDGYIQPFQDKEGLLKPKTLTSVATNLPRLLPNIESSKESTHKNFYRCSGYNCSSSISYISEDPGAICPRGGCNRMNSRVKLVETEKKKREASSESLSSSSTASSASKAEGGFVKGMVTYTVMDDLMAKPMSTISSITLLNRFNVKDVGALEEKTIGMGINEGVKLLKASLQAKTVLNDVFLGKKAGQSNVSNSSGVHSIVT